MSHKLWLQRTPELCGQYPYSSPQSVEHWLTTWNLGWRLEHFKLKWPYKPFKVKSTPKNWSVFVIYIKFKGNVQNYFTILKRNMYYVLKLCYVTVILNFTKSNKSLEIIETPAFYDILDGIEKYRDVLDVSSKDNKIRNEYVIRFYYVMPFHRVFQWFLSYHLIGASRNS